jgi:glycosyltransferase involved in cell wall biosynthesis
VNTLYIAYFGALKHLSHSQILPYLRELADAGLGVTLLSFEERGPDDRKQAEQIARLRQELEAAGIEWHWLRYHKRPSIPATAFDVAMGTLFGGYLILRKKINVVHARGHVPGLMALLLKRLTGVKLLFDLRGLMAEEYVEAGRWPANGLAFRATKWVEEQLFQKADSMVMLTRAVLESLKGESRHLQHSAAHIEIIPCCVDLRRFGQREQARGENDARLRGKTVMVYVGSTGGWYMSHELARLFAVGRLGQPDLHFLVLTQSPHEQMRALLLAEGLPEDSFTIKTAKPAEVAGYLAAADFGVHFIRPGKCMVANSPTKFAEYLASGLPILSNAGIGDSDEILRQESVGVIVDEFDQSSYERAFAGMRRLLADPDVRRRCREVAERRFALNTVGRQSYVRVYRSLGWSEAPP